jgi:antitoxin YefM
MASASGMLQSALGTETTAMPASGMPRASVAPSANEIVPRLTRAGRCVRNEVQSTRGEDGPGSGIPEQAERLLSDVADRRDHVLVTRNGKPAAVLVPIDEYEALEETAEILSDSATLAAIEAGLAELGRDETVTLTALRAELAERRTTR